VVIQRGEIWWASLRVPKGSEPGYRRPVIVVQSDAFNQSRIGTVVVAAITSNPAIAAAPGNIALGRRKSGLPKPSVVNVSQVLTLDKTMLTERVKTLSKKEMVAIDNGLRLVLGL
jgi:mRNA interferase MazF